MSTGRKVESASELQARIAKGWKPNRYLTNMSMAFFANVSDYVATSIFPICLVDFSTGYYYIYNKGDLARDAEEAKVWQSSACSDGIYRCDVSLYG